MADIDGIDRKWRKINTFGYFILAVALIVVAYTSFYSTTDDIFSGFFPTDEYESLTFILRWVALIITIFLLGNYTIYYGFKFFYHKHASYYHLFKKDISKESFLFVLILLALSVAVIIAFSGGNLRSFNTANEGLVFAFILGLITVFGFMITLSRIRELHGRIINYETYLSKAAEVLKDACKDEYKSNVRFLCYTPLHGHFSVASKSPGVWKLYYDVLIACMNKMKERMEIVCLDYNDYEINREAGLPISRSQDAPYKFDFDIRDPDKEIRILNDLDSELWKFYKGFSDRHLPISKRPGNNVEMANREELLRGFYESLTFLYNAERNYSVLVIRKKYSDLPTYHFIQTENSALIGIPLQLPHPVHIMKYYKLPYEHETIEMIGFQTEEMHMTKDLEKTFNYYKGSEHTKTVFFGSENKLFGVINMGVKPLDNRERIPVVFVHGLSGDHKATFDAFEAIVEELTGSHKNHNADYYTFRYDAYGIGKSKSIGSNARNKHHPLGCTLDTFVTSAKDAIQYVINEFSVPEEGKLRDIIFITHGIGSVFAIYASKELRKLMGRIYMICWAPIFFPFTALQPRRVNKVTNDGKINERWIGPVNNARVYSDELFNSIFTVDDNWHDVLSDLNLSGMTILKPQQDLLCTSDDIQEFTQTVSEYNSDVQIKTHEIDAVEHLDREYAPEVVSHTVEILSSFDRGNWVPGIQ